MSAKMWRVLATLLAASLLVAACAAPPATTEAPPEPAPVGEEPMTEEPTERTVPAGCTYNAYRMGWLMDYSDANNIVNEVFHPTSPFQYTYWDDEDFRSIVSQALLETDPDARVALWAQAQDILVTDYAAVIPIFHYDFTGLVRPEIVGGFPPFGSPHYSRWQLPEGQTALRVRLATEPPTLDPNIATDTTSHEVIEQLMQGLYAYTDEGEIEPAAAVSYEVSADGLVYTINLRPGAVWSDGQPVTAQHFVDGIIRLLDPATAAEYAYVMYYVAGAEAFNTGETDDPSTVGVRAVDDLTLEITLGEPQAFFDSILAFSTTYPVRLDVIEQYGELWTEPGNFVGNGAYVLTEWAHNDYLILEANPTYWDAASVSIPRIEFRIITEDATSLAAYERGELDRSGYPSEELPRILETMADHFVRLPRPGTYYIGLSTLRAPTDNLNLRMALASAVDKRAILDSVMNAPWRIDACGVIPPEIPGYGACGEVGYAFDMAAAQAYLEAAMAELGVTDPGDISVNLWFNRGNETVIEAVGNQWETNLGINVEIVNMEWGAYLETLDQCNN